MEDKQGTKRPNKTGESDEETPKKQCKPTLEDDQPKKDVLGEDDLTVVDMELELNPPPVVHPIVIGGQPQPEATEVKTQTDQDVINNNVPLPKNKISN